MLQASTSFHNLVVSFPVSVSIPLTSTIRLIVQRLQYSAFTITPNRRMLLAVGRLLPFFNRATHFATRRRRLHSPHTSCYWHLLPPSCFLAITHSLPFGFPIIFDLLCASRITDHSIAPPCCTLAIQHCTIFRSHRTMHQVHHPPIFHNTTRCPRICDEVICQEIHNNSSVH